MCCFRFCLLLGAFKTESFLFLFYLFPYCVLSVFNVLRVLRIAKTLYAILQVTSAFVILLHLLFRCIVI